VPYDPSPFAGLCLAEGISASSFESSLSDAVDFTSFPPAKELSASSLCTLNVVLTAEAVVSSR